MRSRIAKSERLGRELHDGLCQSLAGIAALCSVLSRSLAVSGRTGPAAAASEIVRLLNEAIGEARDLAHGLSPIGLTGAGLVGELETLARIASNTYFASPARSHGIAAVLGLTWKPRHTSYGSRRKPCATRSRTAEQMKIDISLECADGFGRLSIRDNGVGLSEDDRNRGGIGLHTMDYRARAIGGCLTRSRVAPKAVQWSCAPLILQTHELRDGPSRCPC